MPGDTKVLYTDEFQKDNLPCQSQVNYPAASCGVKGTVLLIESHQEKADEGQTFKNELKTTEVIRKRVVPIR